MILQIDSRLWWKVQDWGCNVLVAAWHAVRYGAYQFDPESFNRLCERWVHYGVTDEELTILNYETVYRHLGLPVDYTDRHESPDYRCGKNEFEHLCWQNGSMKHFTAGNGGGIVTYDPMGFSVTVRDGRIISKRIMRIV